MFRPLLLENPYLQSVDHHDVDFQLRMYGLGAARPPSRGGPALVVLTRSDDMEVSELSLGLAQRGVRLVRINRDDPAGRALWALRPDGIFHGQGEWLRTQAVWVRHFWDPGVRGDADRVHEAYVQEQLNALPGTLSEVGGGCGQRWVPYHQSGGPGGCSGGRRLRSSAHGGDARPVPGRGGVGGGVR